MTQTGTIHAHRALVAGAWASRSPANVRRHVQLRLAKPSQGIQDSSGKAQGRLCQNSRPVLAGGKHVHQVVAIARERVGCMWAIAKEIPVTR